MSVMITIYVSDLTLVWVALIASNFQEINFSVKFHTVAKSLFGSLLLINPDISYQVNDSCS